MATSTSALPGTIITNLPITLSLNGTEIIPIVQAGTTKQATINQTAAFASSAAGSAPYVLLSSAPGILPNARQFLSSSPITLIDAGPSNTLTVGFISSATTAVLDNITSSQGALLYRSSLGWTGLTQGTSNQVLISGATPSWSSAPSINSLTVSSLTVTSSATINALSVTTSLTAASAGIQTVTVSSLATIPILSVTTSASVASASIVSASISSASIGTLSVTTSASLASVSISSASIGTLSVTTSASLATLRVSSAISVGSSITVTNNVAAASFTGVSAVLTSSVQANAVGTNSIIVSSNLNVGGVTTLTGSVVYVSTANSATSTITPSTVATALAMGTQSGTIAVSSLAINDVRRQIFTASGTYTPTTGMLYCIIECIGGGGGGGGVAGSSVYAFGASGGSGGGYARLVASSTAIGASQTVTIGGGGAGGAAGGNNGAGGGTTSVGTLCVATGGTGGTTVSSGALPSVVAAGVGTTGDLLLPGGIGGAGSWVNGGSNISISGGWGAPSYLGAIVQTSVIIGGGTAAGSSGRNYGGGGTGGAVSNLASNVGGGNGASGVVFITEFCNQ